MNLMVLQALGSFLGCVVAFSAFEFIRTLVRSHQHRKERAAIRKHIEEKYR